ncbi:hypothetical protein ACWCQX_51445, partial [Streptomyces sp. NPDC002346]
PALPRHRADRPGHPSVHVGPGRLPPAARAYYHSARLGKAETELRAVLQRDPVEHYARLMLGRTLERQGRQEEATPHLRMAAAMSGDFGEDMGS